MIPGSAFSSAGRSTWVLEKEVQTDASGSPFRKNENRPTKQPSACRNHKSHQNRDDAKEIRQTIRSITRLSFVHSVQFLFLVADANLQLRKLFCSLATRIYKKIKINKNAANQKKHTACLIPFPSCRRVKSESNHFLTAIEPPSSSPRRTPHSQAP